MANGDVSANFNMHEKSFISHTRQQTSALRMTKLQSRIMQKWTRELAKRELMKHLQEADKQIQKEKSS